MEEEQQSNAMYYSVDNLNLLAEDLGTQAQKFSEVIDNMFSYIYGMGTGGHWKGATYNQFKTMCDTFKTSKINAIIEKLNGWSKGFADIAIDAANNTAKNKAVFEDEL